VGASCSTPTQWDIIVETNPNPQDPTCVPNCPVQWIRYQLQGTTLMRGLVNKTAGDDPSSDTSASGVLVPFVQNVVNNACPTTIPTCQSAYPGIFSGGPVPVFTYVCDTPTAPPGNGKTLAEKMGMVGSSRFSRKSSNWNPSPERATDASA